jgi:hypothetical protein
VILTGRLRLPSGETEVKLTSLASGGVCIEFHKDLPPGMGVEIVRGDMRVPAVIAWAAEGKAGLRFDKPIDAEAFRRQGHYPAGFTATPLHEPVKRLTRRQEQQWAAIWSHRE